MGDAQSAQRERNEDAEAEEESAKVDDAPAEHNTGEKPLRISEINGKADSTIAEANERCEEEMTAEEKDVSGTAKQTQDEETPLESIDINEKESPNEEEEEPLEIIEMDAKQNDINDSFRKFFSNISLKLSVKRGSVDKDQIATDDETNKNESNGPDDIKETVKEAQCDEQSIDLNAQGTYDNDSTTCPTLTDVTSEDIPENTQEKSAETKEDAELDNVDTATTSPVAEEEMVQRDAMFEEDLNPASTASPEPEEVVSPVKRFFTTGIFSGLRKKKMSIEEEAIERELVEMGKGTAQTEEKSEDIQRDNEISPLDTEATTVERENIEKDQREENQMMDGAESPTTNSATVTANEPENTGPQDKVQDSPLKWLGSSFRKTSKKQRSRKSSHEKLSESGEHSDLLKTAAKSAETPKEESPTQHSAATAAQEDGAWASFKKLLTPKKHMKRSSLTNEDAQIASSVAETKPSEGEQMSDNSTEEGKKRKDSSVSWEAVLCGSGKKSRSRKTSDSEDETPPTEDVNKKETTPQESSSEADETANSPKQAGSPSEGEGGSTWKSFKKFVTPKRKAKDEEESKDNIQSDSEVTQDEPSFSIKKFLPGRKKKKTAEDQVSSDEADKEVASDDEDSETPAVVPLSEFDTIETEVQIEAQVAVESPVTKETDDELQQDLPDQVAKPVIPSDSLQTDTKNIQTNGDNLKNEPPAAPASHEEAEDLTESFSNHHQLSDIPEEGIITDTIATQASIAEEAARDDTIMEDLIEITSEAITAPEPIDETEMISAVSQLSESSNTSGNITPVPVEYDVRHTEALLQQVVETISISSEAEPVCSEEINSNRILETLVKRESPILETHRRSDATSIVPSVNAEGTDIIEHSATAHTESISEINESLSREIVSDAPTEEFVTAEIAVDEVHEVSVSRPEEACAGERQPLVERQCEINDAVSMETLPEVESIVSDEVCLVEAHLDEKERLEIDSQEAESAAIVAEESEDGTAGQEDQTPTHKEEQILPHITEIDNKDQPEVEGLQELQAVQDATSGSEEDRDRLLEKEQLSEDCTAKETIADEPKEEAVPLTEYNVDAKTEKVQADAGQPDHAEELEVVKDAQTAAINVDMGSVQLLEKEVVTEDNPSEETVTDKPKEASESLTQYIDEEMEDKMQVDAAQTEENVLEAAQTTTLDSEEDSSQVLEKEVTLENTTPEETVTDKPEEEEEEESEAIIELDVKAEMENQILGDGAQTEHAEKLNVLECAPTEETGPFAEYDVETENKITDAAQTEHAEELEVLDVVQTTLNLEKVNGQEVTLCETVTDKPNKETQPLSECNVQEGTENRLQTDAAQAEQVLEAVQTATLDLEDNSGQLRAEKVISEDTAAGESMTDESNQDTQPLTEYDIAAETGNKFQEDAAQTLHTKGPEVLEAVPTATLDLEKDGGGQLIEKDETLEDIQAQETVTNEPNEETQPLPEYDVKEATEIRLQTDAAQTTQVGKPEVLEAVQTAPLDCEEDSGQFLPKEVISEDIPVEETVTDEAKEETELLTEYIIAAEAENQLQKDAAQTEHTGEPETLEAVQPDTLVIEEDDLQTSNESDIPEAIPAPEMFANETDKATEDLSDLSSKADDKDLIRDAPNVDQEVLSENTLTTEAGTDEAKEETEPLTEGSELVIEPEHVHEHEVVEDVILARSAEDVTGQQPEMSPSSVNDTETDAVTEVESSMAAQTVTESAEGGSAYVLKVNEDQKTESTPQDAQVGQEDHIPEVVDEAQTVTAVCVSSADDEEKCAEAREKPVFSKVTPAALVEKATFARERTHVEEEKGAISGFEVKHAAVEHAIIAQVTACHLKDVVAAIPDALIETKSDSHEPLIETMVSQIDFKETTETATPLVTKYVTMTEEDSSVVLMNVPLVECKDNCHIQVQVVNVDINSAEKTVDTVLQVGITEEKEAIGVCHKPVKVDELSETEETLVQEENMVIIQEVTHVESESVLVKLEQEDAVAETCETAETELSEVKDQNVEDATVRQRQEDVSAVPSEESAGEEQIVQTPDIPAELHLDEEEEPKTEVDKSVTTEEVKLLSDLTKKNEETIITQSVKPNTGLVIPQNTGIISSTGNVESPSSLSLEFKLNIQFGQVKEPASPPPTTERTEPVKKPEVSEIGVQAVEPEEEPEKVQKTTELVDVAVQGTEITETEPVNVDQTESQPQLLDVGMQTVTTEEPAEQLEPTERGTANDQVNDTTETIINEEKIEIVSLSRAGFAEVCEHETQAEEPVKHTEEEADVWMDAEEDVDSLEETETSLHETDEPPEHQCESNREEMSVPEAVCVGDMAATSRVKEEEENQQMVQERATFESEGEDLAVALEDSATATASTAIMEWD